MEYVAWYLIIMGVTSLSATGLFCWYGYWTPSLYLDETIDEDQAYIDHIKLEHKRLEELWIWRREDD